MRASRAENHLSEIRNLAQLRNLARLLSNWLTPCLCDVWVIHISRRKSPCPVHIRTRRWTPVVAVWMEMCWCQHVCACLWWQLLPSHGAEELYRHKKYDNSNSLRRKWSTSQVNCFCRYNVKGGGEKYCICVPFTPFWSWGRYEWFWPEYWPLIRWDDSLVQNHYSWIKIRIPLTCCKYFRIALKLKSSFIFSHVLRLTSFPVKPTPFLYTKTVHHHQHHNNNKHHNKNNNKHPHRRPPHRHSDQS